VCIALICSV